MTNNTWEERFDECTKKTFLNDGFMVIEEMPPHNWIVDPQFIKKFIAAELTRAKEEGAKEERERIVAYWRR